MVQIGFYLCTEWHISLEKQIAQWHGWVHLVPHHRNAGFIRQQHAPGTPLPDESGVPRGRGVLPWRRCLVAPAWIFMGVLTFCRSQVNL
jgi:hypothetical protein